MFRSEYANLWIGIVLLTGASGAVWSYLSVTTENPVAADVAALRKVFPYVALSPRLSYETRRKGLDGEYGSNLRPLALERMKASENRPGPFGSDRAEALEKLHSQEAERFINSPGNGRSRLGITPRERLISAIM